MILVSLSTYMTHWRNLLYCVASFLGFIIIHGLFLFGLKYFEWKFKKIKYDSEQSANWEFLCHSLYKLQNCFVKIGWSRVELEKREEKYDVIVGDLADPVEEGPCYQLYTKSFYEQVLKPKLHHHGIFVTQVGHLPIIMIPSSTSSLSRTPSNFSLILIWSCIGWTSWSSYP